MLTREALYAGKYRTAAVTDEGDVYMWEGLSKQHPHRKKAARDPSLPPRPDKAASRKLSLSDVITPERQAYFGLVSCGSALCLQDFAKWQEPGFFHLVNRPIHLHHASWNFGMSSHPMGKPMLALLLCLAHWSLRIHVGWPFKQCLASASLSLLLHMQEGLPKRHLQAGCFAQILSC